MKIQEVAGNEIWTRLRKQIDLIRPKAVKLAQNKKKKRKGSDLERATGRLNGAVTRLKPRSPIKPVQMARPRTVAR